MFADRDRSIAQRRRQEAFAKAGVVPDLGVGEVVAGQKREKGLIGSQHARRFGALARQGAHAGRLSEIGARYFILLTTAAGLYRYDISDVVEVTGKYHELPLLRFVHKGPDMLNMTGEKVHAEQVATAVMRASQRCGVAMVKAQAIPNLSSGGYDLLLEAPLGAALAELARVFDAELSNLNPEYENKRRTGRLASPLPVRMKSGWSKRLQAADVANGSRETQYKWPFVRHAWDAVSRPDVAPDESSTTPDGAVRIPSDDPPR